MTPSNDKVMAAIPETEFQNTEDYARSLDECDPLVTCRQAFRFPKRVDGTSKIYFCGNSLGLQPVSVASDIHQELEDWANLAVDAHFEGNTPWYSYHEVFRQQGADLVGAVPGEVVMMNSLTVNLHLMMVSFYRPTVQRYKILMEAPAFPSDTYALKTQLLYHGYDPTDALIIAEPREGQHTIDAEVLDEIIERHGETIALVMIGGVNFFTGQVFDMARITSLAHAKGCTVGFDLAHAAGNIELSLHDWNVDFAVWCSYKYLNSGPGAVAGCFVHERHGHDTSLPRFAGWWGNDPNKRFLMHLLPEFEPRHGADGWQLSNPPIMALAPLKASLGLFDQVGMAALRAKSQNMAAYMIHLMNQLPPGRFELLTPLEPQGRGCQVSLLDHGDAKATLARLQAADVICDFREPNVIRVAPVPLYNSFHEIWQFVHTLGQGPSS